MFEGWIFVIKSEYESRFQSFKNHGKMFTFIIKPDEIEENVLNLQYFQYLKIENYIFGSTYKCEQIFSQMKFILSKNRSRLTTENSDACIRLKTTDYTPDLTKLTSQVQHQGSH